MNVGIWAGLGLVATAGACTSMVGDFVVEGAGGQSSSSSVKTSSSGRTSSSRSSSIVATSSSSSSPGASSSATSSSASSSASSAAPCTTLTPGNGYFTSGAWHGYAWADAYPTATTFTPKDFSAVVANGPFCVTGSLAATNDYSAFAVLGVNLNQNSGAACTVGTAVPTSTGVRVSVTNNTARFLRIVLVGASDKFWCTTLPATGDLIPWSSFSTECWGSTGSTYNGKDPLKALQIMALGDLSAVPFDFCLNSLSEG